MTLKDFGRLNMLYFENCVPQCDIWGCFGPFS
jgi:hypothetical protein